MKKRKGFLLLFAFLIVPNMLFNTGCGPGLKGWVRINEGKNLVAKEDYEGSIQKFQEALRLFELDGYRPGIARSYSQIGYAYRKRGDYQRALLNFEKALTIEREMGDRNDEADILNEIGAVYISLSQYDKALEYFREASEILMDIGKYKGASHAIIGNIATVYLQLGQYQKALSYYKKSFTISKENKDRRGELAALINIGNTYHELGEYQKAITSYKSARTICIDIKYKGGECSILNNLSIVYGDLGQYQKAIYYNEEALRINQEIGSKPIQATLLHNLATIYAHLGQNDKAFVYFQKALGEFEEIGNKLEQSKAMASVAKMMFINDQYNKALSFFEQALTINKEIGTPVEEIENEIGWVYFEMGNIDKAAEIFKKTSYKMGIGKVALAKKDFTKALDVFRVSLRDLRQVRKAEDLFASYLGLALSYEGLKDYTKAKENYLKAAELTEEIRDSLIPSNRGNFFGTKLFGFSRLEPYEGLVRVLKKEDSFYYAEYTKARVFSESIAGRKNEFNFRLPESLADSENTITNQTAALYQQRKKAYTENRMEAYENIDMLIREKKKEKRKFVERIRKDYPEYASLNYPEPIKASEIPLVANEYLIEYEITDSTIFAWLVHNGAVVKTAEIAVYRKDLIELVRKYRTFFQVSTKSDLARFDPTLGHKLYNILMKDILVHVPKDEYVIIVPDEILGILPFEALVSKKPHKYQMGEDVQGPYPIDIRYVGDDRNVSYCQSATSLGIIRRLHKKSQAARKMLVVADPIFDVADTRVKVQTNLATRTDYQMNLMRAVEDEGGFTFPRLERTSAFAKKLDKMFNGNVDVLEGPNATCVNLFKQDLSKYRYLVFATHGILDNQVPGVKEPSLVLTQVGNPENDDGFLTMSEVMNLRLDLECCALIACETGLGRNVTGEGVVGLARAFQYAGANSVLVSMWSVSEQSTTELAEQFFYYLIKNKKTAREALKLAKSSIRKQGYEHPFYWAPFILIGQ